VNETKKAAWQSQFDALKQGRKAIDEYIDEFNQLL